jgi:hypothetical protein
MNTDLINLSNWFAANKLTLNISKTNYISYSSSHTVHPPFSIYINEQKIANITETTILGVTIDLIYRLEAIYPKLKPNLHHHYLFSLKYVI